MSLAEQVDLKRQRWRGRGAAVAFVAASLVFGFWYFDPLRGLPDIGEPLAATKFRSLQVPDADNAFVVYRQAAAMLVPWRHPADAGEDWAVATAPRRQWLADNQPALALFVEGSTRPNALYNQPTALKIDTILPVTDALRNLARVATLEASRHRAEADPAGAWTYLRAILRASRHCGTNGVAIERLVGAAMLNGATPEIERWATDPRVDPVLLQQALADVIEAEKMTPKARERVLTEYLMLTQTFDDPRLGSSVSTWVTSFNGSPSYPAIYIMGVKLSWDMFRYSPTSLWMRGEPEKSKRLLRLALANWLEYCDRPRSEWPKRLGNGGLRLFEPEANAPKELRIVTVKEMSRFFDSSLLSPLGTGDAYDPLLSSQSQGGPVPIEEEEKNLERIRQVLRNQIESKGFTAAP
jgi:hypothetical protein